MGRDHQHTAKDRDTHFGNVARKSVSLKCREEDASQAAGFYALTSHDALGRARMKSRDTLEPNLGLLDRAASAAELREAEDDESNGKETERAVPKSLPRRILASWRVLDRIPGLIWLKKMAAFPIGERFAVICVTAALFTPRTTFIVLLAWGGFALLYTSTGRTLRTLAKWRSLPR